MLVRVDRWLFGAAILASAFGIFLVQPMVGKRVLPWFGGGPAVWAVCLTFFQITLFFAYAYAHALIRYGSSVQQLLVHGLFCAFALATLPVLPENPLRLAGNASTSILAMLAVDVAPSFLCLAATGPLVQAWFTRAHPGRSPYFLYAVSNLGSLAALLAYPFVLEPRFGLADTGDAWSVGFGVTAAAVLGCAAIAAFRQSPAVAAATERTQPLRTGAVLLWLLLSGSAVVLLMGVTNELCRDTVSLPFLWIVPLGAYLLTFIVCFAGDRYYRRAPWLILAIAGIALQPYLEPSPVHELGDLERLLQTLPAAAGVYAAILIATCMGLHGELYRIRPPAGSLTAFFLCVSAGGALGGLFVGVFAELLFDDYHELPIGFVLWFGGVLACAIRDPRIAARPFALRLRRVAAPLFVVASSAFLLFRLPQPAPGTIYQERSFFGVLRVLGVEGSERTVAQHHLRHGSTLHGVQFMLEASARVPTIYFGVATGIGSVLARVDEPVVPRRVAVVGLGAGTLAAYGRPGDLFRFYEIDPAVIRIARDRALFSFLADSQADVEIVPEDGRLALEAERDRGEPTFDVIVVDAFSGDSIPVHLLTREAFAIYRARLSPQGILAIHASSRYIRIASLALRLAGEVGLRGIIVRNENLPEHQSRTAVWVLMSARPEDPGRIDAEIDRYRRALEIPDDMIVRSRLSPEGAAKVPIWTDDHSDLVGMVRTRALF